MKAKGAWAPALIEETMTAPRSQSWSKLPWLRWSFDAWLRDPGLRLVSLAARGAWMDLLALAAASEEPGVIIQEGQVPTDAELSKLTGIRKSTLQGCIKELEKRGVFSRDKRGAIYSRRMVRDARDYQRNVLEGSKGGNPMLLGDNAAADPMQTSGNNAANLQQSCSNHAEALQQVCNPKPNDISALAAIVVIPPVKADSDSESEEKNKKRNPDGFPAAAGAEVVSIETARKAATGTPRRRGMEAKAPSGTSEQIAEEDRALQLWNALAAVSYITAGTMASDRRMKLRARLKEIGGLPGWHAALDAVERSDLWQGRVGRGWRPTFDDILSPTKLRKLLEGGYSDTPAPSTRRRGRVDPNEDLYQRFGLDQNQEQITIDMEDE